jgi:hypothetical protein
MIAMEKPKATITRNALIFLLEMFLTALVKAPKFFTVQMPANLRQSIRAIKEFFRIIPKSHSTSQTPSTQPEEMKKEKNGESKTIEFLAFSMWQHAPDVLCDMPKRSSRL